MASPAGKEVADSPKNPKKRAARKAAPHAEDTFDVSSYLVETAELSVDELALDSELSHGQVRKVDVGHVEQLVREFRSNPPTELELTTIQDQGGPPSQGRWDTPSPHPPPLTG
jgi:hypothetical protein